MHASRYEGAISVGTGLFNSTLSAAIAASRSKDFITVWRTTGVDETITIPAGDLGTYNATIDWGDGSEASTITSYNDVDLSHTYAAANDYIVTISGSFPWFYMNNTGSKLKLIEIVNWGNINRQSMSGAFYGCSNMTCSAVDNPFTSKVTLFNNTFRACDLFNGSVSNFDTRNAIDMDQMFRRCGVFNQSVSNFDTSNVTNMNYMFRGCYDFNQSVSNFDTSNVTNMYGMFYDCYDFNQSVSNFDTSNVTSMYGMFYNCNNFNQSVSNFDVSSVTNMGVFLGGTTAFSTTNYDAALIAFSTQSLQNSVFAGFGSTQYSAGAAATARASIISTYSWVITDGGQVP